MMMRSISKIWLLIFAVTVLARPVRAPAGHSCHARRTAGKQMPRADEVVLQSGADVTPE